MCNYLLNFASNNKNFKHKTTMNENWFVYIVIAVVAFFMYWGCDKLQILKSKPLRIFVVLLISSVICWVIYDLLIS